MAMPCEVETEWPFEYCKNKKVLYGSKEALLSRQKPFLLLITTKGSCWQVTVADRKRG